MKDVKSNTVYFGLDMRKLGKPRQGYIVRQPKSYVDKCAGLTSNVILKYCRRNRSGASS